MTECSNPPGLRSGPGLSSGPGPGSAPGPGSSMPPAAWAAMTQLYLCEESYWSKYDRSEICPHALQINVISDGKEDGRRVTG